MSKAKTLMGMAMLAGALALGPAPLAAKGGGNGKSTAASAQYAKPSTSGSKFKIATTKRKPTKHTRVKKRVLNNTKVSKGMQVGFRETRAQRTEARVRKQLEKSMGGGTAAKGSANGKPSTMARIGNFISRWNPISAIARLIRKRPASVELSRMTRDPNTGKLVAA